MIKLNIEVELSIGIDSTEKYRIIQIIRLIPPKIAQSLIDKEYIIRIKHGKNMCRGTAGQYCKLKRIISLEYYFTPSVLYHEIGHFVDMDNKYYGRYFSDTQIFTEVYVKEKHTMSEFMNPYSEIYKYCTESIQEYFAQSFAHYIMEPEKLKRVAPYTYKYIARCIEVF